MLTLWGRRRNAEATNKRFAINVFKKGDLYYRSGDALRRSKDGHWYFLDRLGGKFVPYSIDVAVEALTQSQIHSDGMSSQLSLI